MSRQGIAGAGEQPGGGDEARCGGGLHDGGDRGQCGHRHREGCGWWGH